MLESSYAHSKCGLPLIEANRVRYFFFLGEATVG